MSEKLKVLTVVGTRPEIIRLSRVFAKLNETCNHLLVHTGQNYDYELNEIFFDDLDVKKPDYFLNAAADSAAKTIGNVIAKIDKVLDNEKPDAILLLGDTNSCLSAIAAKRRKIPIFHMEAGNRCFDFRVPEEINRRIVDHVSDINLPHSAIAREYLLKEGFPPDQIIKIGSPMFEVLNYYRADILNSDILKKLNVRKGKYFLFSLHREENIEDEKNFSKLMIVVNSIAKKFNIPVIFSTHPRTKKRIDQAKLNFDPRIRLIKPLGFKDYNQLQINARTVFSDSGTITEEASILNFPALNVRESHERPEGMENAAVMLCGLDVARVMQCLSVIEYNTKLEKKTTLIADYSVPDVSDKVVKIIHSYTDYINRVVWQKH
jgi:UDP-N-acetyl-L-fucosamine synthase